MRLRMAALRLSPRRIVGDRRPASLVGHRRSPRADALVLSAIGLLAVIARCRRSPIVLAGATARGPRRRAAPGLGERRPRHRGSGRRARGRARSTPRRAARSRRAEPPGRSRSPRRRGRWRSRRPSRRGRSPRPRRETGSPRRARRRERPARIPGCARAASTRAGQALVAVPLERLEARRQRRRAVDRRRPPSVISTACQPISGSRRPARPIRLPPRRATARRDTPPSSGMPAASSSREQRLLRRHPRVVGLLVGMHRAAEAQHGVVAERVGGRLVGLGNVPDVELVARCRRSPRRRPPGPASR